MMRKRLNLIGTFLLLIVIVFVLFSFAMFQGGFVSWFLFYGYLPIIAYQLLFSLYPIRRFRVLRKMPEQKLYRGESAVVTVQINRRFPFPLSYYICEEIVPDSLQRTDKLEWKGNFQVKHIILFGFSSTIDVPYTLSDLPRGEHELTAIRIRTGDLFGIVKKEHVFQVKDTLEVYPNRKEVYLGRRRRMSEDGTAAASLLEPGSSIAGVREYMPGDRLAYIDWKQTAKRSAVMTKEFEQETNTEVTIVLNSCFAGEEKELTFETAVELANSLAAKIVKQAVPTKFLSIGKEGTVFDLNHAGARRNLENYLMGVKPAGSKFSTKLRKQASLLSGALIIVTPFLDDMFAQSIHYVKQMTSEVSVLFILPESELPSRELEQMKQLEAQGIHLQKVIPKQETPLEVTTG